MANNAVLQRGYSLPEKTYKEQNLTIPEFDWISIFIMITLWVLGTIMVSKAGLFIFPRYNKTTHTFIVLVEILAQLLFIALILFLYQSFIFYPLIECVNLSRQSCIFVFTHFHQSVDKPDECNKCNW